MQCSSDEVYLADHIIALASSNIDEHGGSVDARFTGTDQVAYSIGKTAVQDITSDSVSSASPAKSAANQTPETRDRASAELTTRS
jgi:hypothetical protein